MCSVIYSNQRALFPVNGVIRGEAAEGRNRCHWTDGFKGLRIFPALVELALASISHLLWSVEQVQCVMSVCMNTAGIKMNISALNL